MSIKQILMTRDGISSQEAQELINEAREDLFARVSNGDLLGADDICMEYFGLEPDYLMELL